MRSGQFTVLIGSCARGTNDACSDIDIVRIGHRRQFSKKHLGELANPQAPISYIDYDCDSFASLYKSGSLFIHHILTEGKLLAGDSASWFELKKNFRVTDDLFTETMEQLELCRRLARPEAFVNANMPLLSHLFRALKNAAIFSLAQRGIYIYDKQQALARRWKFLTEQDIELLLAANNLYVRGTSQFPFDPAKAADLVSDLCSRVNVAVGELLKNGNQTNPQRDSKSNQRSRGLQFGNRKERASRRV